MRKSTFTEGQIAVALRHGEVGTPVAEIIRKLGISEQTYRWKRKCGLQGSGPRGLAQSPRTGRAGVVSNSLLLVDRGAASSVLNGLHT